MWSADEAILQLKKIKQSTIPEFLFEKEDYDSNDGMQTAIFGPLFWSAIHMVSFNYPVNPTCEQKEAYRNWLISTGKVLPCRYCRDNFITNYENASCGGDDYASRDSFSRFCFRLHQEVNRMLKKDSHVTFEEVRDIYEGFRSRCLSERQKQQLQKENKELGCIIPMHGGTKGKCVISVVPREAPIETFSVAEKCRRHPG